MPDAARIALACAHPTEGATLTTWLTQAGFAPVALNALDRLEADLQAGPVEALVADSALIPGDEALRAVIRRLGSNRPLLLIGEPRHVSPRLRSGLSIIGRPLDRDDAVLAIGLALAEGRPARRFARRLVEPVDASAQGIAVKVTETSVGGVGLDLQTRHGVLPPFFNLRIPNFGVFVLVRRAWMAPGGSGRMRCGGTIEGDLRGAHVPWTEFVRDAPAPLAPAGRRRALAS